MSGGKLPGKTEYAGRRRAMTRRAGFSVHPDTTGGEFRQIMIPRIALSRGEVVEVTFSMHGHGDGDLLGYGLWFWRTTGVEVFLEGGPERRMLSDYGQDSWNKAGSIWPAPNAAPVLICLTFRAAVAGEVAIHNPLCGRVEHKHLTGARTALLSNIFELAPEGVFVDGQIEAEASVVVPVGHETGTRPLLLKSCNRCGRFLPINVPSERDHLSFTNHCVAEHRRPCRHGSFGRLRNADDGTALQLDYGYQLECRFCKKFEVNAAHNPQRSSAQMKEDGARRRAFEFLLAELYEGTPQLRYRHQHRSELADDVWNRFGCACFNCGTELPSARAMNLDHTRPLAFLWPLDGSATALCKTCNGLKRDRAPHDFYTPEQLVELASITGIPLADLREDRSNEEALDILMATRDWFFSDFLTRAEMIKERDGKITGELVVKALQRVLAKSARHAHVDLQAEYARRRG
jgi:hypothetical protein